MNSKLQNRKLTGRRSTKDEERIKNDKEWWRTLVELITKMSQKHYGSSSAWIFSIFLLLLTNFKWNLIAKGAEPFPLSLQRHFIGKMEEELAAQLAQASWRLKLEATCSPRRVGCFLLMGPDGPRAEEHPLIWSVHLHFEFLLAYFHLKHCKTLRIAQQLALSNSMWPAKIRMSTHISNIHLMHVKIQKSSYYKDYSKCLEIQG